MTDPAAAILAARRRYDDAVREAARAEGALGAALERLREEYGCETLAAAEALLAAVTAKSEKAKAEFETALKAYEGQFGDF